MKLESIIGLEIHVQLKTRSKMFCSCPNALGMEEPNTCVCPVCLGHPGVLPVPNKQAIEYGVMAALALNCEIPKHSKFDRKHYFYPDLPKAYQISQFDEPIGTNGHLELSFKGELKKIRIHRLHLEEDAAKLIHAPLKGLTNKSRESFVDYNRGGTPLAEIVTEADLRSPEEAGEFLRELRLVMRYLGVSSADMEKGHLRCDANISLRPIGDENMYNKTEVKNLNSFKAVEKALAYEVIRQTKVWEETGEAPKELGTRGWDDNKCKTIEQRTKEESADYRYFPDPDIPELDFEKKWINSIRVTIPELPQGLRNRFCSQYGFKAEEAKIFSSDKDLAEFTENVVSEARAWIISQNPDQDENDILQQNKKRLAKIISSWILTNLLGLLRSDKSSVSDLKITPENMAELIILLLGSKVNKTNAQKILEEMYKTGKDPSDILEEKDLGKIEDDESLNESIKFVIASNPDQVEEFKSGKEQVVNYLVGQVMKQTKGKADPEQAAKLIKENIK